MRLIFLTPLITVFSVACGTKRHIKGEDVLAFTNSEAYSECRNELYRTRTIDPNQGISILSHGDTSLARAEGRNEFTVAEFRELCAQFNIYP